MSDQDKKVTVKVNGKDVILQSHEVTGEQIIEAAIAQGVDIKADFSLFEIVKKEDKTTLVPVGAGQDITVKSQEKFKAVDTDDNS